MEELRARTRRETIGGILYSYDGELTMLDTFSGLLSNISETGACIYTQEAIEEGSHISIYGRTLAFRKPKTALVMWCNRIYDDLYRVGLTFPQ